MTLYRIFFPLVRHSRDEPYFLFFSPVVQQCAEVRKKKKSNGQEASRRFDSREIGKLGREEIKQEGWKNTDKGAQD